MTSPTRAYLKLVPLEAETSPEAHQPTMDDSELLAALRAGDPRAAAALYDRTRSVVDRPVARLLGRRDNGSFRGDCPLDAWGSMISARIVYKHIRRRRLERQLFSAVPVQALGLASEVTRRELVFRDALRRVQEHLSLVDANRSWTFLLHDVYGYDLKEVASITSVSVAAAQSRLVRGRREVHERIGADPELAALVRDLCGTEDQP